MTNNHTASDLPPPTAVESFVLTSCHPIRHVASDRSISLLGTLKTTHPEEIECGMSGSGMTASAGSPPLESSHGFEQLQAYLSSHNATGWSVSAWFTPLNNTSTRMESILTFGVSSPSGVSVDGKESGGKGACSENYFQIAQFQSSLLVRFQDSGDSKSCRTLFMQQASLAPYTLTQVSVTVGPTTSNIYVNGQSVLESIPFVPSIFTWNPQTTLQLFSAQSSTDTAVFQGSIEQVSFFGTELTPELVMQDFQRGVLAAPPLAPFPLGAVNDHPIVIAQDHQERKRFFAGGNRESSAFLPLAVQVLKLPAHGQVFLMDSQEPLVFPPTANSSIMVTLNPGDFGIWLEYRHTPDSFFSVPRKNAMGDFLELKPDSLEFRVVAVNSTQSVVGKSDPITQEFEIQHVNRKPSWIVQENATVTLVDGLPQVDVGPIQLDDSSDRDMNRVRIDLIAMNGTLTLDPAHSGLAQFTSCTSLRHSNWQCRGNGVNDAFMTFLAVPSKVQLVLSGIRYQGDLPGAADTIFLSVFDGVGGPCLSLRDHEKDQQTGGLATIHRECFEVNAKINVPAIKLPSLFEEKDEKGFLRIPNTDFRDFGLADALFWIVLISILVCCFCCLRQCPNCLARGTAVVPDDYNSEDESAYQRSETDSESDISSISSISDEQVDVESCMNEKQAMASLDVSGGDGESLSLPAGDVDLDTGSPL